MPIYRANRMMRGAAVPRGEHTLVYTYEPVSFRIGAILTLTGSILLAGHRVVVPKGRIRTPAGRAMKFRGDMREIDRCPACSGACFQLAETFAEVFEDGLQGLDTGSIAPLAGIVAFVEELLGPIPAIADVDEIALGQGRQRASLGRRSTLIRIGWIGTG